MASMVGNQRSADVNASVGAHQINAGHLHARVQPADGGRIAEFWAALPDGRRLDIIVPMQVAGFAPGAWPKAGCYPLVPYSNRIRNAEFPFEGQEVRLPPYPAERPHALHGFTQQRPWALTDHAANCLAMSYEHHPDSWPWPFTATQLVSLDDEGMSVDMSVTNHGDSTMPLGFGLHPYFAIDAGDRMRFAVTHDWQIDAGGFGVSATLLADGKFDLRHDDKPQTRYLSGWQGRAVIDRRAGAVVTITASAPLDHLVFHTPDGGAYACIEPVSHVADAFNLAAHGVAGTGIQSLGPGKTLSARIRIEVT